MKTNKINKTILASISIFALAAISLFAGPIVKLDSYDYFYGGFAVGKLNIKVDNIPDIAMCVNFTQRVSLGSSWEVDAISASDLDIKYTQAGWLFEQSLSLSDPKVIADIQNAAWYIVGGTPNLTLDSTAWYNLAINQVFAPNYSDNFVVYRPTGTYGQEFISVVPEPNAALLFAVGATVILYCRRKY